MKEAMFFDKLDGKKVQCRLCRFRCQVADGRRGICGVRENRDGILYSLVYGKSVAEQVDPIEKKPLFHFLPGSLSYSVATMGCNFRCKHCQNHNISQPPREEGRILGRQLLPEEIVDNALAAECRSISYTYTEPTIFYEYAYETSVLAQRRGLKNIFVTNGYISEEALLFISPYLDAANIDLKGFTSSFYREVVGGADLGEVLESIRLHKRLGIWLEITTLVIPDLNDSDEELSAIARFIADELGCDTPWHVSSFHPTYHMTDRSWTPVETVRRARQIGIAAGLRYVYEGNVPGDGWENTLCPGCHASLVTRRGFSVKDISVRDGKCPSCGFDLYGVWE